MLQKRRFFFVRRAFFCLCTTELSSRTCWSKASRGKPLFLLVFEWMDGQLFRTCKCASIVLEEHELEKCHELLTILVGCRGNSLVVQIALSEQCTPVSCYPGCFGTTRPQPLIAINTRPFLLDSLLYSFEKEFLVQCITIEVHLLTRSPAAASNV